MDINVTKTKVTIGKDIVNKGEYNIRECVFTLSSEYEGLVCKALFTVEKTNKTYEQSIVNNKCTIPYEVTVQKGAVTLGVIGYEIQDDELIKRYSPLPYHFTIEDGSYVEDIENQAVPTPSDLEQLEQRVSAIEIDAEQVEINTQNISDLQENKADKSELEDFITKDVNDLTYYTLTTQTGSRIELSLNSTNFKMTATLKDKNGNVVNTSNEIDLPLESVVVNASYDSTTKELILTLQNGTTVRVSIADLISGLQTEITSSNKLNADLVDDSTSTNKFVTASEKTQITTNKNNITSLNTNKEDKSNKVTSLSSSSTDTQYPSAKAVYDNLVNKADKSSLVTGSGTEVTLQNTAELEFIQPPLPRGNSGQDGEPSPTNEVPITNVTGDVEVLVQNKNWFTSELENGWIDANGKNSTLTGRDSWRTKNYIKIEENTIYTLSRGITNRTINYIYFYDENYNYISRVTTDTFTTPPLAMYIRWRLDDSDTIKPNFIQLEENTTATPYTPHKEQTYTFPLGTQRMYLGDYLADDGIHHVRGEYTVTGNESIGNFEIASNGCFAVTLGIKCKYGVYSGDETYWLADKLKAYSLAKLRGSTPKIGICVLNDGFTYVNLTGEASTRESAIASWNDLAGMKIEYLMQNEEITPYTTEQQTAYDEIKQALSYEEQTNISGTSDESNPLFEVQAVQYKEPDYWTIAYVNGQIGNAIGGAY